MRLEKPSTSNSIENWRGKTRLGEFLALRDKPTSPKSPNFKVVNWRRLNSASMIQTKPSESESTLNRRRQSWLRGTVAPEVVTVWQFVHTPDSDYVLAEIHLRLEYGNWRSILQRVIIHTVSLQIGQGHSLLNTVKPLRDASHVNT